MTAPGRYVGMPAYEYHAHRAHGSGFIRGAGAHSVAHVLAEREKPTTKALHMGGVNHCALLLPDRVREDYVVAPYGPCQGKTAKGERCSRMSVPGASCCHQHGGAEESAAWKETLRPGVEIVTEAEIAEAEKVAAAVRAGVARSEYPHVLTGGDREVSYFANAVLIDEWPGYRITTEPEGIPVKARIDIDHIALAFDLKGVGQVGHLNARRWGWRVADYGMHVQAALYVDIVAAVTGTVPQWGWLAHESQAPYGVRFFDMDSVSLDAGRTLVGDGLKRWAHYLETGDAWHGWPTWRETVEVPVRTTEWED